MVARLRHRRSFRTSKYRVFIALLLAWCLLGIVIGNVEARKKNEEGTAAAIEEVSSKVAVSRDGTSTTSSATATSNAVVQFPTTTNQKKKWRKLSWWNSETPVQQPETKLEQQVEGDHNLTKNKEKRSKTGRQKIANCRHLAAATGGTSHGLAYRFRRFWKRLTHRGSSYNSIGSSDSAASATTRDMNVAYGMAIVATLSYWDFHKRALPENRTSLEIVTYRTGHAQPLRRRRSKRGLLLASIQVALDKAQPWISLVPSRRGQRTKRRRGVAEQNQESSSSSSSHSYRDKPFRDTSAHSLHHIQLEYYLYNWYEPTPLGKFHDTDLLIATVNHGQTLILAFAGTASMPDTVTNLQTFEPAQHSGFFYQNNTLQGSIHRGFLNAYSRVERGSILRLCNDTECTMSTPVLNDRYGHCTATENSEIIQEKASETVLNQTETTNKESVNWTQGRGCKVKNKKLITILRDLVIDYLVAGKSVQITGHSLGGSIGTLHALDIIINYPNVPVAKLELWTFGGAQVADDAFLQSALEVSPRLGHFLQHEGKDKERRQSRSLLPLSSSSRPCQFHRFVTVSDDCKVDFVSTVAQKTLVPDNHRNIHGKTARRLGGIKGSSVVHFTDPHYLLTPDQYDVHDTTKDDRNGVHSNNYHQQNSNESLVSDGKRPRHEKPSQDVLENMAVTTPATTMDTTESAPSNRPSTTRSTLAAHAVSNYLKGISRESKDHPLSTNLPDEARSWLGEIMV